MNRPLMLTLLVIFSLAWLGWSCMVLFGAVAGTCDYDHDAGCRAFKELVPSVIFWRWLAVQLAAVCVYLFLRGRHVQ